MLKQRKVSNKNMHAFSISLIDYRASAINRKFCPKYSRGAQKSARQIEVFLWEFDRDSVGSLK